MSFPCNIGGKSLLRLGYSPLICSPYSEHSAVCTAILAGTDCFCLVHGNIAILEILRTVPMTPIYSYGMVEENFTSSRKNGSIHYIHILIVFHCSGNIGANMLHSLGKC